MQTRHATTAPTVVGYQNKALSCNSLNDFVVHTFRTVGTDGAAMTLGDFTGKDNGDDIMWDYSADYLYTLEENGLVKECYAFLCATYAADFEGAPVGWYTKDDADGEKFSEETCQNEVELPYLQGFKVNSSSDDMTLNDAGEVAPKGWIEIALTCNSQNDFTGNVTPIPIKLGDIAGKDDSENDVYWDYSADYLYTLEENGLVKECYAFLCATYAADFEGAPVGWYTKDDADGEKFSEETCQNEAETFEPGDAFKVNASSDDMCLYIPSALGTK